MSNSSVKTVQRRTAGWIGISIVVVAVASALRSGFLLATMGNGYAGTGMTFDSQTIDDVVSVGSVEGILYGLPSALIILLFGLLGLAPERSVWSFRFPLATCLMLVSPLSVLLTIRPVYLVGVAGTQALIAAVTIGMSKRIANQQDS